MNPYLELMPIVAGRGWFVGPFGLIRDSQGYCPICALRQEIVGPDSNRTIASEAALDLGGYYTDGDRLFVDNVVLAADNRLDPLRPALMAALGMKP